MSYSLRLLPSRSNHLSNVCMRFMFFLFVDKHMRFGWMLTCFKREYLYLKATFFLNILVLHVNHYLSNDHLGEYFKHGLYMSKDFGLCASIAFCPLKSSIRVLRRMRMSFSCVDKYIDSVKAAFLNILISLIIYCYERTAPLGTWRAVQNGWKLFSISSFLPVDSFWSPC